MSLPHDAVGWSVIVAFPDLLTYAPVICIHAPHPTNSRATYGAVQVLFYCPCSAGEVRGL